MLRFHGARDNCTDINKSDEKEGRCCGCDIHVHVDSDNTCKFNLDNRRRVGGTMYTGFTDYDSYKIKAKFTKPVYGPKGEFEVIEVSNGKITIKVGDGVRVMDKDGCNRLYEVDRINCSQNNGDVEISGIRHDDFSPHGFITSVFSFNDIIEKQKDYAQYSISSSKNRYSLAENSSGIDYSSFKKLDEIDSIDLSKPYAGQKFPIGSIVKIDSSSYDLDNGKYAVVMGSYSEIVSGGSSDFVRFMLLVLDNNLKPHHSLAWVCGPEITLVSSDVYYGMKLISYYNHNVKPSH